MNKSTLVLISAFSFFVGVVQAENRIKIYGVDEYGIRKAFPEKEIIITDKHTAKIYNYDDLGIKKTFPDTIIRSEEPLKRHFNDAEYKGKIFDIDPNEN